MRNYGQHSALICGLEHASGDFVITMDDDLQNPPEEIIHLIEKAEEGYDAVFGKFHQKMHGRVRGLGSQLIGWLNTRLFNKPPDLVLTNFRLLRREVVDAVCEHRTAFPYLPGLVLMTARTFANVAVEHRPRTVGRSNYNPLTILRLVWRIVFNYSAFPIRLLCGIGGVVALGAFALGIYFFARSLLFGTRVPGWTSLVVLLSFHMGFMLLLFSAIGEYLARILVETSGRRSYRIRRRLSAERTIAR
jgi:glycosyltransferase involved in cell wall biosynthesis